MPFALLGWFLKSRAGNIAGIVLLVVLAAGAARGWLYLHDREVGRAARAKAVREMLVATQAEAERRESELLAAKQAAEARATEIETDNVRLQLTLTEITHASAAHDNRLCLVPDQLRRLHPFGGIDRRQDGGAGSGGPRGGGPPPVAPLPPARPADL